MVPRVFSTPAEWLAALLRRYGKHGDTPNVYIAGEDGVPSAGQEDERLVALIQTRDGRELVLTGERIIERGQSLIWYGDVVRCHWITDHNDPKEKARLKQTHFDRLILETESGPKVILEELGPVVFPLIRFFDSIISAVGPNAPTRPESRKRRKW